MADLIQGAALDYIIRNFNGLFDAKVTQVVVGAAPVMLAAPNPDRVDLAFIAVGSGNCNISTNPGVRQTQGIYLGAAGSSFTMTLVDDLILPTLGWYAIEGTAATTVTVVEVIRYAAPPTAAPAPAGA